MNVNYRAMRRQLLDAGFSEAHGRGGHVKYLHPSGILLVRASTIGSGRAEQNWLAEARRALRRAAESAAGRTETGVGATAAGGRVVLD